MLYIARPANSELETRLMHCNNEPTHRLFYSRMLLLQKQDETIAEYSHEIIYLAPGSIELLGSFATRFATEVTLTVDVCP